MKSIFNRLGYDSRYAVAAFGALAGLMLLSGLIFAVAYHGKVLPGVQADGVDIGGLARDVAEQKIAQSAAAYQGQQLPVQYNQTTLRIPVSGLAPHYSDQAIDTALAYGRSGGLLQQLRESIRAIMGGRTTVGKYDYDDANLTPFLDQVDDDVTQPVANASLNFDSGQVQVQPSHPGVRVDRGRLTIAIGQELAKMGADAIDTPIYHVTPTIDEEALTATKAKAEAVVSQAINVTAASKTDIIDQGQILNWLNVSSTANPTDMAPDPLQSFYSPPPDSVALSLNQKKVAAYVAKLAQSVDQEPQDAGLTEQNGQVVVTSPSRDGVHIDQAKAAQQIMGVLNQKDGRDITLSTPVTKAEVREDNLDSLGIKEQISEGQTFFPGSTAARMTNVRVGAARYNNVLLKPDEVFSFGKILGDVGPAQGYLPELVILGNHEEKQYGGGLCQVASTAYRAALLAGLPIVQRTNHSFAVSYYTAPYGVPGVDATIYYPEVDLKFRNDTGHYILIQTTMQGTSLTFDFYGTKTKTGEIRGPQFVSGTNDAKQPSHTIFWRDIKDTSGNVIKTDTINTYYKSSEDFKVVDSKQFN